MNAAALQARIADAVGRLSTAESEMDRALREIGQAAREDKSIIGAALGAALTEMKAAQQDLLALEKVIAEE